MYDVLCLCVSVFHCVLRSLTLHYTLPYLLSSPLCPASFFIPSALSCHSWERVPERMAVRGGRVELRSTLKLEVKQVKLWSWRQRWRRRCAVLCVEMAVLGWFWVEGFSRAWYQWQIGLTSFKNPTQKQLHNLFLLHLPSLSS